jgi:hypothetical protein
MARRDDRGGDDGGVPRAREPVKRPGPLPDAAPVPDKAKLEPRTDGKSEARSDRKSEVLPPLEEPSKPEPPQASSSPEELRPRRARVQPPVPIPPALIPLVHAPDDPGPDPEAHVEPEPEPTVEPLPDSWSRIRQLFRQ